MPTIDQPAPKSPTDPSPPTNGTALPATSSAGSAHVPREIKFRCLRPLAKGQNAAPKQNEHGDWLLPFVPKDGRSRTVQPEGQGWFSTGVAVELPPDVIARVLFPSRPAHPGHMLTSVELDARHNGHEITVKVHNVSAGEVLYFTPGQYYFVLRLCRRDDFVLKPA